MIYISIGYYIFLLIVLLLYYLMPIKYRWVILLIANCSFYYLFYKSAWFVILLTAICAFIFSHTYSRIATRWSKVLLGVSIVVILVPCFVAKRYFFGLDAFITNKIPIIVPLGISFYTLEIISYLVDVYKNEVVPEKNFFKFLLFVGFFPKLVQGPISRYKDLGKNLLEGHYFNEVYFTKGFYYLVWGFFLKLVISDKAGIIVNSVFDNFPAYTGLYIWLASILYCIQLYTDFLACTTIAQGVSLMFGIELIDNFNHPFFSKSIKELWRRWHISLGNWLKNYVYIPLGGSKKGILRKYLNLIITFIVSGIWHGTGITYIVWGLVHAFYQIVEDFVQRRGVLRNNSNLKINEKVISFFRIIKTFLLFDFAAIIFQASSLSNGTKLIKHMFTEFNPWIIFNDRIFSLGLSWKEFVILVVSIIVLFRVEYYQELHGSISDKILEKNVFERWVILITGIIFIVVFGTYGFGYNAQDFIYGGF